ncbi:hypothetical protein HLBENOHH_02051 [Aeromonas dhakensis]|uniref:phage tail tip fiber protein n=1 Tax=Aeromonas dhakensis TaxID=196024 RepID=UPI0036724E00
MGWKNWVNPIKHLNPLKFTKNAMNDVMKWMGLLPENKKPDDQGFELGNEGAAQGISLVYGQSRTPTVISYHDVSNKDRYDKNDKIWTLKGQALQAELDRRNAGLGEVLNGKWICTVYTISHGPIEAITQIWVNGEPILLPDTKLTTCGTVSQDRIIQKYKEKQQLIIQYNTAKQDFWHSEVGMLCKDYKTDMLGKGIASISVCVLRSDEGVITSEPEIDVEVQGRLLRDIRYPDAKPQWKNDLGVCGQNPGIALYDYATSPNGMGFEESTVDRNAFAAFANYCTRTKFNINGYVDTEKTRKENFEKMQADFQCQVVRSLDKWTVVWNAPTPAICTITEDDMYSGVSLDLAPTEASFNVLEVKYKDAKKNYQQDVLRYPSTSDDELLKRYGRIITKKVDTNFTTSKEQVDTIAGIMYEMTRDLRLMKFTGGPRVYALSVGDVVNIKHPLLGDKAVPFRVTETTRGSKLSDVGTAEVQFMEYKPNSFDHNHKSEQSDYKEYKEPEIQPPRNLTFKLTDIGNGTVKGLLEWFPAQCSDFKEYVVQRQIVGDDTWERIDAVQVPYCPTGNMIQSRYNFRVFAKTRFGKVSDTCTIYNVDVQDDTVLPQVTGLKLNTTSTDPTVTTAPDFNVEWDPMLDVVVKADPQVYKSQAQLKVQDVIQHYEVEIYHGENSGKFVQVVYCQEPRFNYTFAMNAANGTSRYVTFKVRIVSRGGSKSRTAAELKAKNTQCQAPVGVMDSGSNAGIQITWDACEELDYRTTHVYLNRKQGFKPTAADIPSMGEVKGNFFFMPDLDGKWYGRIAHADIFGDDGLVFSPEYLFDVSSALHQMTDMKEGLEKVMRDNIASATASSSKELDSARTELEAKLKTTKDELNKSVQKEIDDRGVAIKGIQKTISDANTKVATDMQTLRADFNGAITASVDDAKSVLAAEDKSLAQRITSTESKLMTVIKDGDAKNTADLGASVRTINESLADLEKAQAQQIETVQSSINGVSATVQKHDKTIADINGTLRAESYMKANADGVYAGIGMIADKGTKKSSIIFDASDMLFADPASKSNKPIMEIRDNKVMIVNGMIDNLTAANIKVGSLTGDRFAANSITSNHITANIQLNTPTILMPNVRIGDGHAGFGLNGPFGAWGQSWNTLIQPNGTINTNSLNATSGNIQNMQIKNCTIAEDCTVLGYLYADRIIGLPAGKSSGLSAQWMPLGRWMDVLTYDVASMKGRFDVYTMPQLRGSASGYTYGPAPNVGGSLYCNIGVRVLVNGNEIYKEVIDIEHNWEINNPRIFSWCGNRINCGSQGAHVIVQICGVATNRIGNNHGGNWSDGFAYTNKFSGREADVWLEQVNALSYSCIDA